MLYIHIIKKTKLARAFLTPEGEQCSPSGEEW